MAGENVSGASEAPDDSLEGWLDAKAEELGVSRVQLLAQLQHDDSPDGMADAEFSTLRAEFAGHLADAQAAFESELAEVEADLANAEREFDEKIQDVRERVVQVKRETDEKALADHDHADLRERTESVADRTDRLAAELDSLSESVAELESLSETVAELESLSETVADLDEQVETGFENFEDVLEYLTDATDDIEAKLTTLAEVVVHVRDQTQTLTARHASQAAADELAHLANRRGVESAKCSHCGETVYIGLLAEPNCPHCASTFNDVEPKQGLFGSAHLVVGDPPALEGERADWDVSSVMNAEATDIGNALDDIIAGDDE